MILITIGQFPNCPVLLKSWSHGVRVRHSTVTATTLIISDIVSAVDEGKYCAALFVNLTKAFDTVDYAPTEVM